MSISVKVKFKFHRFYLSCDDALNLRTHTIRLHMGMTSQGKDKATWKNG